jgi:transposase
MSYSLDLRKRVIKYVENGGIQEKAASIFGVSPKTVSNWIRKKREGNLSPITRENKPRKINYDSLRKYIEKHPDAYLREIAEELEVTPQAVFYACKRLRITLKKRHLAIRSEMKKKEQDF